MAPSYKYRSLSDSGTPLTETDVTDYFRLYTLDVAMNAEEGSVAQSTVFAHDPDGDIDITGHRRFRIVEDTATGSNTTIWVGYTAARRYRRGDSTRTGISRDVDIDIVDVNSILPRRIFDKARANRPAETDVARIQWLLTVEESQLIDDDLYFNTASPVAMDAVDYRGQTVDNLLNDCSQQSGKNYFVWYNDDTNQYSLFYDFASGSNYTSPIRLTNVLSEVDNVFTFAISQDTQLQRSPDRVFSGAYLQYDGGAIYTQLESTADDFARRDANMPAENVKTATKAKARAGRYLASISTEEDVITTTVQLPAAKVNFLMQGMRVRFKATHLPGYTESTYVRALTRSVSQVSEEYYDVKLELAGATSVAPDLCETTTTGEFHPLGGSEVTPNASGGNIFYLRPGLTYPEVPTPGFVGGWGFPLFGVGGSGTTDFAGDCTQSLLRFVVSGNGTASVSTATYAASARGLTARLHHRTGAEVITDETQTGTTGDTFTFTVDTHAGVNCYHWIDVIDNGGTCGGKWGFTGAEWTAG
jgi:hypothetical protein